MNAAMARDQWLGGLAAHFSARQDAILACWRHYVDADPELSTPGSLSRVQFNDRIPDILDAFVAQLHAGLQGGPVANAQEHEESAEAHGLHRWQQGYRLKEVTREWSHLQRCLLDELSSYAGTRSDAEPSVVHMAYRALVELCSEGVGDSTAQYFELQQLEAVGHVRDLSETLDQLRTLERQRAAMWRQAAHDLRGNFGIVTNATAGLSLQAIPEAMREELFRLLQKSVSSVNSMLNEVMSLARLEAGQEQRELGVFDAALLLRETGESFEPLARERGLFLRAEGPQRFEVMGDAVKIRRIVQNLLLNGLKYTESGGVTVSWGESRPPDADHWMFAVRDTGPGYRLGAGAPIMEALEAATQEAKQVEQGKEVADVDLQRSSGPESPEPDAAPLRYERGEGIGLSIVKRLCDLLDASIEVESTPGEGTVFRVIVPRGYA